MPRFFIVNANQDGVATEQITDYKVYLRIAKGARDEDGALLGERPLQIKFYHGDACLGTAQGEYAERFLAYAAAHRSDGTT
jgi:hypothetical protein